MPRALSCARSIAGTPQQRLQTLHAEPRSSTEVSCAMEPRMPVPNPVLNTPRRILLIRPSALGDVCRTVPVLASLKQAFPDADIDWLVNDAYVDAVAAHPDLHEVVPFPRRRFAHWWRSPRIAKELAAYCRTLRQRDYDLVLDCQGLGRSGLLSWATRAPMRIADRHAREWGWLGATCRIDTSANAHDVDRMLALLEGCSVPVVKDMRLHVPESDRAVWRGLDFPGGDYAVLAPASRWNTKAWPAEKWAALAEAILDGRCEHILLIGAPNEREAVSAVHDALSTAGDRVHDMAGRTSVGGLMAVIEGACITVSNDSAALHMAVGLGGRCVGLYGPTNPDKVGPYALEDRVVRATVTEPVHYRDTSIGDSIMDRIEVDEVLTNVDAVLVEAGGAVS